MEGLVSCLAAQQIVCQPHRRRYDRAEDPVWKTDQSCKSLSNRIKSLILLSERVDGDTLLAAFLVEFRYLFEELFHLFRLVLASFFDVCNYLPVCEHSLMKASAEISITKTFVCSQHLCQCPFIVELLVVLDEGDELRHP